MILFPVCYDRMVLSLSKNVLLHIFFALWLLRLSQTRLFLKALMHLFILFLYLFFQLLLLTIQDLNVTGLFSLTKVPQLFLVLKTWIILDGRYEIFINGICILGSFLYNYFFSLYQIFVGRDYFRTAFLFILYCLLSLFFLSLEYGIDPLDYFLLFLKYVLFYFRLFIFSVYLDFLLGLFLIFFFYVCLIFILFYLLQILICFK